MTEKALLRLSRTLLSIIGVPHHTSIKETMRAIDQGRLGIAFIINKNHEFLGLTTDGDIRRAILKGIDIEKPVETIMNIHSLHLQTPVTHDKIKKIINSAMIPLAGSLKIPVIDKNRRIVDIIFLYHDKHGKVHPSQLTQKTPPQERAIRNAIRKVLIIGGAGYIGSVLSRTLLNNNYEVTVLDNLTYGDHGITDLYGHKFFRFIKGDCRNIGDLIESTKGVHAVIHLAAIVGDPACAYNPEETLETNYLATKAIAEVCKFNQINKFLFASTCSVYGSIGNSDADLNEDSPTNPISLYAESKLRSEQALLSMVDENFAPTIFRLATVYGVSPRMRFDLVVNVLTAKAAQEKKIAIFGGEQYRPFIEVSDVAHACLLWLKAPKEKVGDQIFNLGSTDQNYKIAEIGQLVQKYLPHTQVDTQQHITDERDYNVSFEKIAKELNFSPSKTVADAILEISDLFQNNIINDHKDHKYHNYNFISQM